MRYPNFLKQNDTIGVISPSCGSNLNPYRERTMRALKELERRGYKIKRGHRIFRMNNVVSAPAEVRAKDFMSMYKNKYVDFIWSTAGGELMMSMLPFVDFNKLAKYPPKFFMGFSDNTNLTFTITTLMDVATIYGHSYPAFGMDRLSIDAYNSYELAQGNKLSFDSYDYYYGELTRANRPLSPYEEVTYLDPSTWKSIKETKQVFEGRIIGGCLDVLVCLCGTPFDNVKNFIEKYKDDGIIWYFDVCDLNSCALNRALFQLEQNGWFKYVKGFVVGRCAALDGYMGYTFEQAIKDCLTKFNVPVIYEADFSHKKPTMSVINGSIATVSYEKGKGNITYKLK